MTDMMHKVLTAMMEKNPSPIPIDFREDFKNRLDELKVQGLPNEALLLYFLEVQGGECPKCKKPWKRIDVKNVFVKFYYHKPTCRCFPICPWCESLLFIEMFGSGYEKCRNCKTVVTCKEIVSKKAKHGDKTRNVKAKCDGRMILSSHGYICEDCRFEVSFDKIKRYALKRVS